MQAIGLGALVGSFLCCRHAQLNHSASRGLRTKLQPEFLPSRLGDGLRGLDSFSDHLPYLFGERGVDVEREVVDISAEGGDKKMHLVLHKSGDEVHVPRQTVKSRDNDGTTGHAGSLKGRGKTGT